MPSNQETDRANSIAPSRDPHEA